MRYAQITPFDVCNGEGIGCSLFIQGCHFHCDGCFNLETWDFAGGKEWTLKIQQDFLKMIEKPFIKRISILGGEPLDSENLDGVLNLLNEIRFSFPEKDIWIYSGYTWEQIMCPVVTDDFNTKRDETIKRRREVVKLCDVLVDGRYVDSLRDVTAKWRGSTNQRVIDIKKSLSENKIVLYCD